MARVGEVIKARDSTLFELFKLYLSSASSCNEVLERFDDEVLVHVFKVLFNRARWMPTASDATKRNDLEYFFKTLRKEVVNEIHKLLTRGKDNSHDHI